MDILPLQIFILKRITQAHLLNIRYPDIFSLLKNVIPVLTDLRRKILEIVDLRWHSRRRPFICIIIPAISVLLKNICSLSVQRFSEIFQNNTDRLVRRLGRKCFLQCLVDKGLHIPVLLDHLVL